MARSKHRRSPSLDELVQQHDRELEQLASAAAPATPAGRGPRVHVPYFGSVRAAVQDLPNHTRRRSGAPALDGSGLGGSYGGRAPRSAGASE